MNSATQAISPLRQRMTDDMRMRKLTPQTQSSYICTVRQFAGFLGRSPETATAEDLRRYQLHLVDDGHSPSAINAAITGLKFFYETTIEHPELLSRMQPVHLPHKLPVVLSREEVARLDCRKRESETPDGAVGRLRRWITCQRSGRAEGK